MLPISQQNSSAIREEVSALKPLLMGLAIAELYVRRAVQAAEAHGLDSKSGLQGLFVEQSHIDRLLGKAFSAPIWTNGHEAVAITQMSETWTTALLEARHSWQKSCQLAPKNRLSLLIERFALSAMEVEILLITLLPEVDPSYGRLLAYLHDDMSRKRPSVNLILDLLADNLTHKFELRRLLLTNGRLHTNRLLHITPPAAQPDAPFLEHTIQPAQAVVNFLLDQSQLDSVSQPATTLHYCSPHPFTRLHSKQIATINQLCSAKSPFLTFIGAYGSGKQEAVNHIAVHSNGWLLQANLQKLANSSLGWQEAFAHLLRDGRLHAATLTLTHWETILHDGICPEPIWQKLHTYPHTIIVTSSQSWQPRGHLNGRFLHTIQFPAATYHTRLATWQRLLAKNQQQINLPHLANLFQFNVGQIEDVVATAHNIAQAEQTSLTKAHCLAAARHHSNQRLSQLATHIIPRHRWQEIILPSDTLAQLHEIVQRIQHKPTVFDQWAFEQKLSYGKGLAALFVGESGTGKTLAADIIANELGLDLYKIDLSALVSKYIGETEKNLERVFSEAASSNAVLFFDEADAIFGKRGEINDSHDRYANLEVSYLLQRMERFDGIVILASNLQTNIDNAFTRRLAFIIKFPLPQEAERAHIWQVSLPPALPLADDVDLTLLADKFEMSGGHIRNAVLSAAFFAAAEASSAVHMRHLLHATRREYQKLGRLIDESSFENQPPGGFKHV